MELSRHFFAEAKYENRNLPRHLPRQLPSAEANYEGCLIIIVHICRSQCFLPGRGLSGKPTRFDIFCTISLM